MKKFLSILSLIIAILMVATTAVSAEDVLLSAPADGAVEEGAAWVAPEGITITCPDLNTVVVTGINKELVGHVAADIRAKRKVEPYHGYGLHYSDEVVVRKEGKKGAK